MHIGRDVNVATILYAIPTIRAWPFRRRADFGARKLVLLGIIVREL